MQLEDWLDDLCVRFIINLPPEELESVERICFQVEEAQWFYEDFIRPLDPSLPSLSLRAFSLRIFQHCPLFSQWSAQHHTTAFAEFLAYKSRVPVRGAILLSEAMDEVVLVKGWKKNANWSFPRGKINKDENDLDCAIREVYEETGFDIRSAGLVKDEKDMKYIEVTMREQHMRLYVFRGVPRDAVFEPKTRKEISKIDWYRLTDLPTLKKNRQIEGGGTDQPAMNANKFYMVAPFLNPLKKWITQQRKKENRYSSHLAAPPILPEEATPESDQDRNGVGAQLAEETQAPPSDLPEVSAPRSIDPTSHLKEILNIGSFQPPRSMHSTQPAHMPQVDTERSNALLALLRSGSQPEPRAEPQTPLDQILSTPVIQKSPHISHVRARQTDHGQPPPPFPAHSHDQYRPRVQPPEPRIAHAKPAAHFAPYQQTGDPLSAYNETSQPRQTVVPPASALPTLTNHTKALLDVFKSTSNVSSTSVSPEGSGLPGPILGAHPSILPEVQRRSVTAAAGSSDIQPDWTLAFRQSPLPSRPAIPEAAPESYGRHAPTMRAPPRPETAQKVSLLGLFSQPPKARLPDVSSAPGPAPVELAATKSSPPQNPQAKKDELLNLLRRGGQEMVGNAVGSKRPSPREGETSATMNGPLNQPAFEAVARTTREMSNDTGRNPLPTNRTLFDPSRPAPVKILTRTEEPRTIQGVPRSPRSIKAPPKRTVKEKVSPREQSKPFQPQILRRPLPAEHAGAEESVTANSTAGQHPPVTPWTSGQKLVLSRTASQTDEQKQMLLSLFGGASNSTPKATVAQPGSGIVSPLSASQVFSASNEVPVSAIEPISTRTSRVGSLASIVSGSATGRAPSEKRQTGAENKAFLLGYLGRIASQEH